ncbi:MAG: sugar kinase [Firmicutes bacterium]|nr:sugar kinase [Bacillota bacterium]
MSIDVITFGETMVLMNPDENGSLKYVNKFTKQLVGAESNLAIGLSHLGIKVGWISKLGRDSFGDYVEAFIRGEGVDVSRVKRDENHLTGLMVKERCNLGETRVYYYRKESAASNLSVSDLDEKYLKQAKYLHLTGITPALSNSCRDAVYYAIDIAHKHGLKVIFDPNLRLKLWKKEEMKRIILDIFSKVDIILPGLDEGKVLFETADKNIILDKFMEYNPELVIMKTGEEGAVIANSEMRKEIPAFKINKVVDNIGAGDGFAAGFIAALLKGYSLEESVKLANAVGAFALTVKGDIEGLPTWDELQIFLGNKDDIER